MWRLIPLTAVLIAGLLILAGMATLVVCAVIEALR